MTPLSQQIAIIAAALTQPFTSDAERHAFRGKLQWIASGVHAMETDLAQAHRTLAAIEANEREQAEIAEVHPKIVRLRPALTIIGGTQA